MSTVVRIIKHAESYEVRVSRFFYFDDTPGRRSINNRMSPEEAEEAAEIANSVEPVQDGRIHIELINWPFLQEHRGTPAQYKAGLDLAIERGWLWLHESGTQLGAGLRELHIRMTMRSRLSTVFYVVVIAEVDAQ
jgi:hypothetical protein